jgi:hypothetical protein
MIALCSKTYYCFGKEDKFSCKGINKRTNQITKEKYMDVLLTKQSGSGTGSMFGGVITGKPILLFHPETLLHLGFDHFFQTGSGHGKEDKFSCKGINKRTNQITKEKYMDVLLTKQSGSGTNRGFRKYKYIQQCTMNFLKKINSKENQRGILTSI